MAQTKREKLSEIKDILVNAGASVELVNVIENEIDIITNKYDNAKLKKQAKQEKEYSELEPIFLQAFENNPNLQIGNDCDKLPTTLSVSKKSVVFNRLIGKKLVKKIPPQGKQKRVLYQLA